MTGRYGLRVLEEHSPQPGLVPVVEQVHTAMCTDAEKRDVPNFALTVVVTGDVTASVRRYGEASFQPERLGGNVLGKTLAQQRDYSETVVVLGAATTDDVFDIAAFVHVSAHEYGHLLIGRLRAASGTRPPCPTRAQTFAEAARILAYEAADEYWCNLLSNNFLNRLQVTVGDNKVRGMHLGDLFEDGYRRAFLDALDSTVYPGWPDLVDAYRTHQVGLEEMAAQLVASTDQILKLVAHADSVDRARGVELGRVSGCDQFAGVAIAAGPVPVDRVV